MLDRFEKEPVFEEAQQAKIMIINGSDTLKKSFSEQTLRSIYTPLPSLFVWPANTRFLSFADLPQMSSTLMGKRSIE